MARSLQIARDACADRITADAADYPIPGVKVVSSPIPSRRSVEDITAYPIISCIGMAFDEGRITRRPTSDRRLMVQINIQCKIRVDENNNLDESHVENLIALQEAAAHSVKTAAPVVENYQYDWQSNDFIRDPVGLPMAYEIFRENNTFQATFTAVFRGML